jgi:hypothetical protein
VDYDETPNSPEPVDGVIDGRITHVWDPSGLVETTEADYELDGIIDSRKEYRYDASGGLYEIDHMSLPSGYRYRLFYDPPCHLPVDECRATSREEVRPERSSGNPPTVEE